MYPGYTYVHEDGLRSYYKRIADATDLGVVLYKRGPRLSLANVAALFERENVVCIKFAQNDVDLFATAVSQIPGDVVWSTGVAERFVPAYALEGATGFTTGIGNFAPEPVLALMDAVRVGDLDRARRIRDGLRPYEELRDESDFGAANNVPAVKYGQELAGLYGGPVRELLGAPERRRGAVSRVLRPNDRPRPRPRLIPVPSSDSSCVPDRPRQLSAAWRPAHSSGNRRLTR